MLINLKSMLPVLVMISSMSVPISNRFRSRRANSGKLTSFKRYPYLTPSFERNLLTKGDEILSRKTRVLGPTHNEDFVILACTVFGDQGCDRPTDRHTHGRLGHG